MGSIQKKEFLSKIDRELLKMLLNPNGKTLQYYYLYEVRPIDKCYCSR
jgi:hypothetical protein